MESALSEPRNAYHADPKDGPSTLDADLPPYRQLESLFATVAILQKSVKDLTSTVAEQQFALKDTKACLRESESTIEELRSRLRGSESANKELRFKIAETESNIRVLESNKFRPLHRRITKLEIRKQASESKSLIKELRAQAKISEFNIDSLRSRLARSESSIKDLDSTKFKQLSKKVTELCEQAKTKDLMLKALDGKAVESDSAVRSLREEAKELKASTRALSDRIETRNSPTTVRTTISFADALPSL
jgi:chromosome segregation ATPase